MPTHYLNGDPSLRGFFEPPPLADRHTDITHLQEPFLVGHDGLLYEDIGILWIKENEEDNPSTFYYVGEDEVEAIG